MTISLSDVIVSNSTAGRDYAVKRGAEEENVAVVYNGRNIEQYRTTDSAELRSELDIPTGATVVAPSVVSSSGKATSICSMRGRLSSPRYPMHISYSSVMVPIGSG